MIYTSYTCEDGINQAISDAKKGQYKLISYGLIMKIQTDGFVDFYHNYMLKNYNVIYGEGGCVVSEDSKCYRKKIEELLFEKYGEDFFFKAKSEAITEFRKTEEFIEEIKPKIDSGKVYSQHRLHKEANFIIDGTEVEFTQYLGFANFEKDYFNLKNYCKISFIVEKDGVISNIKFKNSETSEPLHNEELMDKLKSVPKWNAGVYLDELVRTRIYFDVPIRLFETYPR
ncbi:hypothetical protein ACPX19_01245 [Winogradskyella sp. HB-48]|uniref:hypothetical protein n=1 Tax=Winogradskyella sp. HB-48 TaxID=3416808 RepID=UPI003CEDEDB4